MKGKIDSTGWLWIERKGKMMEMYCPYSRASGLPCWHCCAAFREPEKEKVILDGKETTETGRTILELCDEVGVLCFDKFIDER